MAIYLQIEGIDGDVTAEGHEDAIECQSVQWGVQRPIHTPTGTSQERESARPSVSDITITKTVDKASPELFAEACAGRARNVKIDFVRIGEAIETYLEYALSNALISAYSVSAADGRPTESVSFNFTRIEMKYTPYDAQGQPQSPIVAGYDISLGTRV
jgi:type VI secretion system secreted protein Hcp